MGFYASLPLFAGAAGNFFGGWCSDLLLKRTGNLVLARRATGVTGFLTAGGAMLPATLTGDPWTSVLFSCLAVFGLELTIGATWALPLDIGAEYAGSVSSVMNTFGNIGGAISPALLPYLVKWFGWNEPFLLGSSLCLVAAVVYFRIDASRRIVSETV
jgi:predicted MFS family arabinose efflux permease